MDLELKILIFGLGFLLISIFPCFFYFVSVLYGISGVALTMTTIAVIASCFFVVFKLMVKERVESHRRDLNEWHAPRQNTSFSEIKSEIYTPSDPDPDIRARQNEILREINNETMLNQESQPFSNDQSDVRSRPKSILRYPNRVTETLRTPSPPAALRHNFTFEDSLTRISPLEKEQKTDTTNTTLYTSAPIKVSTSPNDSWVYKDACFKPGRYSSSMEVDTFCKKRKCYIW